MQRLVLSYPGLLTCLMITGCLAALLSIVAALTFPAQFKLSGVLNFLMLIPSFSVFGILYDVIPLKATSYAKLVLKTMLFWAIFFPPARITYEFLTMVLGRMWGWLVDMPAYLGSAYLFLSFFTFQMVAGLAFGFGFFLAYAWLQELCTRVHCRSVR